MIVQRKYFCDPSSLLTNMVEFYRRENFGGCKWKKLATLAEYIVNFPIRENQTFFHST